MHEHLGFTTLIKSIIAVSVAAAIAACGSGSSSSTAAGATVTPASFSGPGSKWDFELLADNTFQVERRPDISSPVDLTVDGTYERLSTGFLRMVVSSAAGGVSAPNPGDEAWAIEVPGYALMVKPLESDSDQMIAMVSSGSCPTANISGNWVLVKQDLGRDASRADADYFGTFSFDITTNSGEIPTLYSLATPTIDLGGTILPPDTCNDGIMVVNSGSAIMYLTDNGGALVHTGADTIDETDDNIIFALTAKTITNINQLDGSYAGMLFDGGAPSGDKIKPASLVCTAGACIGNIVTDISTGATSGDNVTVNLSGTVNSPSDGFIVGTIETASSDSGNLVCMVDTDAVGSGKKIVSCVGQSPGDNTEMFNVLFVSR